MKASLCLCLLLAVCLVGQHAVADPNSPASSTMVFQGTVEWDPFFHAWSGTLNATAENYYVPGGPGAGISTQGGFDIYAKDGGTAYVNGDTWVIADHDAYRQGGPWGTWYDPDVPDYQNYHLEIVGSLWRVWGFEDRTGLYEGRPVNETPLLGLLSSPYTPAESTNYAEEFGANWNPIWTWGEENIPLEWGTFAMTTEVLSGEGTGPHQVRITMSPVPAPSSFILCGIGIAFAAVGRRFRRKRN